MSIISKFLPIIFLCSCVTTSDPYEDSDWDDVFPDEEPAEYCETDIEADCEYYPSYYYQ